MFYPARQVGPYNLWIGSERDSQNVTAARRRGIGLVVNCTRDIPVRVPGVRHLRLPIDDSSNEAGTFLAHLPRIVSAIDHSLTKGRGVLVHCYAGVSRSASVVAAFLMYKEGLTPRAAMTRVRGAKPETFGPTPNFERALDAFHDVLRSLRTRTPAGSAARPA